MNHRRHFIRGLQFMVVIGMAAHVSTLCVSTLCGSESAAKESSRHCWADARVYSLIPEQAIASYRSYPSGGVGPGGTLTLGVLDKPRRFNVTMVAKRKEGQFLIDCEVLPDESDPQTQAQELQIDLSDLNPHSLDLARDEDGRVYRLILAPSIQDRPQPQQFSSDKLRFDYFSFPSSPVVLNDMDYIGRLSMSSGPITSCDIPGVAKIEFSLLELKGSTPIGTLADGVINIAHPSGTTLRISDVRNGVHEGTLEGGPYRVWVRWNPPTESIEEYHQSMKQHLATIKEGVRNGTLSFPAGTIERLEKMNASGRIGMTEYGVRGVEEGDLASPTDEAAPTTQ